MFESTGAIVAAPRGPGPEAAAWLASFDVGVADQSATVDALAVLQAHLSWAAAVEAQILARAQQLADDATADPDDREWISVEVGAVLRLRSDFAKSRMLTAAQLVRRLPDTLALLRAGVVTPVQARALAEAVVGLADEACATVQARVLVRAADQSSTQFRQSLRRAVIAAAPKTAEMAHAEAVADRMVEIRPGEHGMGLLLLFAPMPELMRLKTALWRRAQPEDGARTLTQRRADALIELGERYLAETDPSGDLNRQSPSVQVVVSLHTLTGDSDDPGELVGYGPIPASLARLIAADETGTWQRLVTDPLGQLIDYGRTRYRPPKDLADHVRARDRTCVFPTCNRRAESCEIDHTIAWDDGGPTKEPNLDCLCPRHHHLKHEGGWKLRRTDDAGYEWTSPTGRTYRNPLPE